MPDHDGTIYRKTQSLGFKHWVRRRRETTLERAQKTLRHVSWFEVKEQRGRLTTRGIEYQVTIEVGFALGARWDNTSRDDRGENVASHCPFSQGDLLFRTPTGACFRWKSFCHWLVFFCFQWG